MDARQSYAAPGAEPLSYRWDFGDGTPLGDGPTAQHVYARAGGYVARVQVTDAFGATSEAALPVAVTQGGRQPPSARIVASEREGQDSLDVVFACNCQPGFSPIAGLRWEFGDGETSSAPTVGHTFGPGEYEVRLLAVDSDGMTGVDRVRIRVSDASHRAPRVAAHASGVVGPAPFTATLSLRYEDLPDRVVETAWDFGDGTTGAGALVEHTFGAPGLRLATVTVKTAFGLTARATVEVAVTDDTGGLPPLIVSVPTTVAQAEQPYLYAPRGQPVVRGDRPLRWSLGNDKGVGVPSGMKVDADTGVLTWKPARNQVGEVPVTLVAENRLGRSVQEWTVKVSAPVESRGCGCGEANPLPLALGALLWLGLGGSRRRVTRR